MKPDHLDQLRERYALVLYAKDARALCVELGFGSYAVRLLLYGDKRRGLLAALPQVDIKAMTGSSKCRQAWHRDRILEEVGRRLVGSK
jgi:hypothetical protein